MAIQSEEGADAAWTATVPVEPNTHDRLSGWIKMNDARGAVGALLNIQNMQPALNMQHVKTPRVRGTEDWTRVSTVFHSGDVTVVEINCLVGDWGSSIGMAWYDDVAS